jgi:t-SNARE complex subunit (syntaxin)
MAMPIVQRILPLLDGNLESTVANILGPHTAQPMPANLANIEDGLAEVQAGHRDLRDQVIEQNSSLKRVEDQLEMVREATDRNTLEQQELLEDLKTVSNKVNTFAFVALVLLAVSVVLNIVLYLHIRRVLP